MKTISGSQNTSVKEVQTEQVYVDPQKIVVCIPAYQMEEHIAKVVVGAKRFVDQVIVCDDGSDDSTYDIAEALGAIVVKHEHNLGHGRALKTLFKNARKYGAGIIVTIEGSGQYDPSEIPLLLDRMRKGDVDVVIGSRFQGQKKSEVVSFQGQKTGSMAPHLTDAGSEFRVFTSKAIEKLHLLDEGILFTPELLAASQAAGIKIAEVPLRIAFEKKSTTQSPSKNMFPSIFASIRNVVVDHPLLLFGGPGLLAILAGLVLWGYTLQQFLTQYYFSGFAAGLGSNALLVGVLLVVTSILIWVVQSQIRTSRS